MPEFAWPDHCQRKGRGFDRADDLILHRLGFIARQLHRIEEQEQNMALDLTAINQAVAREETVVESAIALLNQVSQAIRDSAGDQAAVNRIADELDANASDLADAVATIPTAPPVEPGEPPVQPPVEEPPAEPPVEEPPADEVPVEPVPPTENATTVDGNPFAGEPADTPFVEPTPEEQP